MLKDFKSFAFKGNLVDLAVAVIIGAAFGAVVTSVVKDIFTPILAAIGGKPDFGSLSFKIGDGVITYGNFLNTLINFLVIAFVLFLLLRAISRMQAKPAPPDLDVHNCPFCLEVIPNAATRCKFCTSEVEATA